MEKGRMTQIEIKNGSDFPIGTFLVDDLMAVENAAWPPEVRANSKKFESRYNVFPEGIFVSYVGEKPGGALTSEIIKFDRDHPPISWEETTDNGLIDLTHDPEGNALYVVSLGVSIENKGLGTALMDKAKKLAKRLGLKYLVLGSRVPGYGKYLKDNPGFDDIEKYVNEIKREDGAPIDRDIRFYQRNGLKVLQTVKDYMEDDPESKNYGVVMYCEIK